MTYTTPDSYDTREDREQRQRVKTNEWPRYDIAPNIHKPPRFPVPRADWQLQELHRVMSEPGNGYVERVTRPDEQFSYNPRTKKGKELLERLNGGES